AGKKEGSPDRTDSLMASARMESKGFWNVGESTGHAQTGLPFQTQPKGYATWRVRRNH
ncbi:MAG: hypothetical protein ACI9MB_002529, partial [Verrucomicrobiales bacterium]